MAEKSGVTDTGQTVTVGCKLPNGLLLWLHGWEERTEPVLGGGTRIAKVAKRLEGEYRINGNAVAKGASLHCRIENGYALTTGIPKAFWDEWVKQHSTSEIVRKNLIFAYASESSAVSASRENEKSKTGLEPLDPQNLPSKKVQRFTGSSSVEA